MLENAVRAGYAEAALNTYRERHGTSGTCRCDIIDLMTDLLLYAQEQGIDPSAFAETSDRHFRAEIGLGGMLFAMPSRSAKALHAPGG